MKEIFDIVFNVSVVIFVAGSMIALGLTLTVSQIIASFKNTKLIILALISNFVIVPLFALGLLWVLPVSEGVRIGIILLALGGGAPFIPKIVEMAKGNMAGGIGLMLLLLIATIFYMPIITPLILTDATVSSWDIAKSLIFTMLIPLALALFIKARFSGIAARIQPFISKLTNISILVILVAILVLYTKTIITNASVLPVILIFFIGAMAIGYLTGGKSKDASFTLLVGTGLRNPPVALLVANNNFSTLPMAAMVPLIVAIMSLFILIPLAVRMGKKSVE